MTKKKNNKQKRQKDVSDTSEEELNEASYQGKICPHVPRAVNFGRVKRILKTGNFSVCAGCTEAVPEGEEPPEVWLCLQCGYKGCGRLSTNQHGLQHFKTIHSDCHSIVLSPTTGVVWCYECDDELQLQSSRNLRQCVEFILKLRVSNKPVINKSSEDKKAASNKPSLIETVLKEQTSIKNNSLQSSPTKNTANASSNKKKEIVPFKISVKGLRNLGNTCYFNAVMQNLSQTALLFHKLEETCSKEYRWEVPHLKVIDDAVVEDTNEPPLKLSLPKEFQLVNTFLQFLKKMSAYSQNKVEVINPNDLFGDLQKKSPQFQYFLQQDSHELLRQFLDGIRQDEVKRQKKAILRHFHVVNSIPEDIDEEVKKLIKAYSCYASHTIVEKIFGGLLISTVLCEECKMSSQVFEPFMDMSLPLFEEKQQENCDQPSPLLDGGKQDSVKAVRIRKPDQDIENGEEFTINKSKKDYSKPSKHQEKKMKQMEKKEKKKNKKFLNKKQARGSPEDPTEENEDSTQAVDDTIENGAQDETDSVSLDTESVSLKTDNGDFETESSELKTEKSDQQAENPNSIQETSNPEDDEESLECSKITKENIELVNGEHSDVNLNSPSINESGEFVHSSVFDEVNSSGESPKRVESNEQEFVVLFDGKVFLNGEPVATSSPTLKKDCEAFLLNGDPVYKETKPTYNETTEAADTITECINQLQACTLSPAKQSQSNNSQTFKPIPSTQSQSSPTSVDQSQSTLNPPNQSQPSTLEPDEHMHNLSMQVTEVRIRRDSDRQESILSSSNSNCDSPKTNNTSCDSYEGDIDENNREDNWSSGLNEIQTREWILKSLTTLKARQHVMECSVDSCLMHFTKPELLTGNNKFRCESCSEMKRRKTGDKKAVVYSNASKQLLIFSPPPILTLHLKRFQQVGMSLRKVNRFVEFPLVLDIASYCSSACLILPHMTSVKNEILYSLYGIVEHSGHLKSGHYTAYVKATKRTLNHSFISQLPLAQCDLEQLLHKFSKNSNSSSENGAEETSNSEEARWYYISDCHVRETTEAQVLKCQAYLLFYERIK